MKYSTTLQKQIDEIMSENKNYQTKSFNKTDNRSGRNWFIVEYSQPLNEELTKFIEDAKRLNIDLVSSLTELSIIQRFEEDLRKEYELNFLLNNDKNKKSSFFDLDLLHTYETTLNHKNSLIDFENKRLVLQFFYAKEEHIKIKRELI